VYAQEVALGYYDREQASWPIATASAVENLAGLMTPALANQLSWRQIELLSSVLFISANAIAYLSDSLLLDTIALGLVQGLGLACSTVLSLAINNDYFERFRTTAYGISMSGSAFGVLYLSPLVSWILDRFQPNFRLVYLALAMVFCANVLLVLFIKPRCKTSSTRSTSKNAKTIDSCKKGNENSKEQLPRRSLAPTGHKTATQANQEQETVAGSASSYLGQVVRKISRIEQHLERKSSLASISYETKSRRQSVSIWRQGANLEQFHRDNPAADCLWAPNGSSGTTSADCLRLPKSRSGLELARNASLALGEPELAREHLWRELASSQQHWATLGKGKSASRLPLCFDNLAYAKHSQLGDKQQLRPSPNGAPGQSGLLPAAPPRPGGRHFRSRFHSRQGAAGRRAQF